MDIIARTVKLGAIAAADHYRKRFASDACQAGRVNRSLLQQILTLNRDTEYGRRYRFGRITTPESYREDVPITAYEDYLAHIDRITAGEENVLTADPVSYFGLTSGATGQQKMIPVTARADRIIAGHMGLLPQGILFDAIPASRSLGPGLNIMNMTVAPATGGIPTGAGTPVGMRAARRIAPYLWTSPPEVLDVPGQQDANYLHLLFALKERRLTYLRSPFPSALVDLFRLLAREWPQLVQDMASGRIGMDVRLDAGIRQELERKLGRSPQRARELTAEFESGLDGIAPRIWPHLLYADCAAGGSFSIYVQRLRQYTGDLPIYPGAYGAAEAMVGVSLRPGEAAYAVTPRTAYHEFIPLGQVGDDQPQALGLDQLTRGENYEMVVTNLAGLYRYRLGDVVRVADYFRESPVIEFLYRRGQLINLVGEKTSEEALCSAVSGVMQQCGAELVDFTTMVDYEAYPCRYTFYVEIAHPGRNGFGHSEMRLEDALCRANPRYNSSRQAEQLGKLALRVVQPGTFEALKGALIARGASASQVKIPRAIGDQELASLLIKGEQEDVQVKQAEVQVKLAEVLFAS